MTVSLTTRLGLYRWSSTGDLWSREQWDANFAAIEKLAAIGVQGLESVKPAPGAARRFYLSEDTGRLWYDDGTAWQEVSLNKTAAVAPTTGAHLLGERVYHSAPAASGFIGWVCVAAGTPGTWKTFGAISA